jgi:uncharacterized protein (DUF2249 family)
MAAKEDTVVTNLESVRVLDLSQLAVDRRAERLSRAFHFLEPGESFWVTGAGDSHHFEHYLQRRFPDLVDWVADYTLEGRWIARVARCAS